MPDLNVIVPAALIWVSGFYIGYQRGRHEKVQHWSGVWGRHMKRCPVWHSQADYSADSDCGSLTEGAGR